MQADQTPLLQSILEIHNLSSGAFRALTGLLSFRNKASGRCCPRISTLSERLGVPYGTVRRWLRELRAAGVVDTARHQTYNSYQIQLLKTCGEQTPSEQPQRPKMDSQERPKMDGQERPKMDGLDSHFLIEQTVLNRQGGTRAAVKGRGVVEKPKKAAAAALPLFDEPEEPAAPPVAEPAGEHDSGQLSVQPPNSIPALARAMAGELLKVHPQPGLPHRAAPEIERVLRAAPSVEAAGETIWNNHAAWMEYWRTLEAGRFIPHLWRWFRDGEWENPPVIRKPAQKESKLDAFAREYERRRAARRA